jgi:hypothetical protein
MFSDVIHECPTAYSEQYQQVQLQVFLASATERVESKRSIFCFSHKIPFTVIIQILN